MTGRTSRIKIEAQDGATSVFDRVAQNIGRSLDDLNRQGDVVRGLTNSLADLVDKFGKGSDSAKQLSTTIRESGASLADWVSVGISAIGTSTTLALQWKNLVQLGKDLGPKLVPGQSTITAGGAVGTGVGLGLAIGIPAKWAIDARTRDLDELTRIQGWAPESARAKERERAKWQKQQDQFAESERGFAADRLAALEDARQSGPGAAQSLVNRLQSQAQNFGLKGAAKAEADLNDTLRAMLDRGEGFSLDKVPEWLESARSAADEVERQEKAAKARAEADKQSADLMDRMAQRAHDITQDSLTKPQKFARDMNEILELYFGGFLGGEAALRALTKSGIENQPDKKKQTLWDSPGNNPVESNFLTRGSGAGFDPIGTKLDRQNQLAADQLKAQQDAARAARDVQRAADRTARATEKMQEDLLDALIGNVQDF